MPAYIPNMVRRADGALTRPVEYPRHTKVRCLFCGATCTAGDDVLGMPGPACDSKACRRLEAIASKLWKKHLDVQHPLMHWKHDPQFGMSFHEIGKIVADLEAKSTETVRIYNNHLLKHVRCAVCGCAAMTRSLDHFPEPRWARSGTAPRCRFHAKEKAPCISIR